MFEFIRTHSKLVLGFLVLLIIPSFVVFGIQGYSRFVSGGGATVAKVAGETITRAEWDAAFQRTLMQLRQRQPDADPRSLDTPEARRQTLEQLVNDRVLYAAARDLHLAPGPERMLRMFDADPGLASLRRPDGKLDRDLLALQGMTPETFDARYRQQLAAQQVVSGLLASAFAPAAAAAPSLDALLQRRELQWQHFETAAYRAKAVPTDAEIEAFYKAHENDFRAPEQATIEYLVLSADALAAGVSVAEADARKFYDDKANALRFGAPEERQASHILVKAEADAPKAEREAAKKRAEELLAQVRKDPASFAEVARRNSQDPGSAAQGGDLGFFARGMMTPPFEEAAFKLKKGEISDVVETDFGYHVILLTGERGGEKKPFEAVREEIENELKKTQAAKRFADSAGSFGDLVYEQSDSLKPAADKFKLEKQTATVQRKPAPGATGALASQRLLDAIFANDVLKDGRNTDAVEIGPSQLAAARVVSHQPERVLPLADVKDQVRTRLVAEQAAKQARADGEKRLAEVRAAPDTALPVAATFSRVQTAGLPHEVVEAALAVDASKLPAVIGIDLGADGYAVAKVVAVLARENPPDGDAQLVGQYARTWSSAEGRAYLEALKQRYKAKIDDKAVAAAAAAAAASAAGL